MCAGAFCEKKERTPCHASSASHPQEFYSGFFSVSGTPPGRPRKGDNRRVFFIHFSSKKIGIFGSKQDSSTTTFYVNRMVVLLDSTVPCDNRVMVTDGRMTPCLVSCLSLGCRPAPSSVTADGGAFLSPDGNWLKIGFDCLSWPEVTGAFSGCF